MLRIGIPNTGRLSELCRTIFIDQLGILREELRTSRNYFVVGKYNEELLEIVFARSNDLPRLVYNGTLQACITGKDYLLESGYSLDESVDLGLCSGTLSILVPEHSNIRKINDLDNKIIATQLPKTAQKLLNRLRIQDATILANSGANELYPHLSLADATIDIVTTGETAKANGLKIFKKLLYSSGRLYVSPSLSKSNSTILKLLEKDLGKIKNEV